MILKTLAFIGICSLICSGIYLAMKVYDYFKELNYKMKEFEYDIDELERRFDEQQH